jgi:siroheme synthase-like protein
MGGGFFISSFIILHSEGVCMPNSANPVLYPIYLGLGGVQVLVVGGGDVAARKAAGLRHTGACVTVVAPAFKKIFKARGSGLCLLRRKFRLSDLRSKKMVFAATDDLELNRRIALLCRRRGILVNAATGPEAGNFQVPASVRRKNFCVAISTGGASPRLARLWRQKLEKLISPEMGHLTELLDAKRKKLLNAKISQAKRRRMLKGLANILQSLRSSPFGPYPGCHRTRRKPRPVPPSEK